MRIDFPTSVPNPRYRPNVGAERNLMRDYQQMMQQQAQIMRSRNARQIQQHMMRMAQLENRIQMDMMRAMNSNPNNPPFLQKHNLKDFDFQMQDNTVYRKMFLPQEYDDTGNLKKPTKAEKAKLRGKNPQPKDSYSATTDEFHPGQFVWVYLNKPKKTSSSSSSSSSSAAKKTKDDEELEDTGPPRPTVKTLVLVQEGSLPSSSQNNNRKKGKKKN